MSKKIRVAIVYGGKSGEHEVSLQSAASVLKNLDKSRFDIIPISIDKKGQWQLNDLKLLEQSKGKELPVFREAPTVSLTTQENGKTQLATMKANEIQSLQDIDVVFPVMHGTFGEDGTIQGLFEMANIPYVGCGVLSSSVGMDKDFSKRIAMAAGIPVAPYLYLKAYEWKHNSNHWKKLVTEKLHYPVFVKPANLGSSVGIHKVKKEADLAKALDDAFLYDTKVLIEVGVNAREIEVAVLENLEEGKTPLLGTVSEIVPNGAHEFYSYESKYLDEHGAELILPAKLSAAQVEEAKAIALKTFAAFECSGMTRVDLFLDRDTNKFYFNELNTIPGFTSISMYPRMMEHAGIPYAKLLTHLIELALKKQEQKNKLKRSFGQ